MPCAASKIRFKKAVASVLSILSCSLTLALREAAKYKLLIGNMSSEAGAQGMGGHSRDRSHRDECWDTGRSEGQAGVGWWKEPWMLFSSLHPWILHTDIRLSLNGINNPKSSATSWHLLQRRHLLQMSHEANEALGSQSDACKSQAGTIGK